MAMTGMDALGVVVSVLMRRALDAKARGKSQLAEEMEACAFEIEAVVIAYRRQEQQSAIVNKG